MPNLNINSRIYKGRSVVDKSIRKLYGFGYRNNKFGLLPEGKYSK